MKIAATITNSLTTNHVSVNTEGQEKQISIPGKVTGLGSAINGGELLFLSLATCFCNDLYREAAKRGLIINGVTVMVSGEFGKEGEPARNIVYDVNVDAHGATGEQINELITEVDKLAEVHNTLRNGVQVSLRNRKI